MQRLAGLDAAFLYMETPSAHMHVTGAILLDPSGTPGGYAPEKLVDHVVARLTSLPLFRKRVVEVPLGLGHPAVVEEATIDPAKHVRRIGAPAPGTTVELAQVVGHIASRPLDRRRPLWELWIVEGLENGHIALVSKIHHALMDGVSGAEVMGRLFDLEPIEPHCEPVSAPWSTEPAPTSLELLTAAAGSMAIGPLRLARTVLETGRSLLPLIGNGTDAGDGERPAAMPFTAPRTTFTSTISADRTVAFGKAQLEDVRTIKTAFSATVNDVVLAACAGALRRYLIERKELPDKPLIATVPVSMDRSRARREQCNNVSAMFVGLPVNVPDPVIRLMHIMRSSRKAKQLHGTMGENLLNDWAQVTPGVIFTQAARLFSRMRLADHLPPVHNLVISNVPGPPVPLYAGGARVLATYPLGPVFDGAGVNITVLSYQDSVDLGVIACPDAVPDPWIIARGFGESVAELKRIADLELESTENVRALRFETSVPGESGRF
ncbi:MAG: wax ester/triacylglycerol synthase family O-acyltransferase [Candidatus Binatia bacterium]